MARARGTGESGTPTADCRLPTASPPATGMFAALRVRDYPLLWASGWLWNLTRWMSVFLASYLINKRTGSPLLVQLAGAAFYAPMLLGGAIGGVVSDRFDRRRTLMAQVGTLVPVSAVIGVLAVSDNLRVWMMYPYMLAMGTGWVLDMTSRRALVYDMVGTAGVTNAMALESVSQTGGALLGNLAGGAVIGFIGTGQTFLAIAAVLTGSWLLLALLPARSAARVPARGGSVRADVAAGLRYVRRERLLLAILGVTIVVNFCYYPYQPLVPVFADRLHVSAFAAGALAATAGLGSLATALAIAARRRPRRGSIYLVGSAAAMAGVLGFALSRWYLVSAAALVLAGAGQAGYNTMQSTLTLTAAAPEMRGRALGIVNMGIGVLPFSLALVGLAAEAAGPVAALAGISVLGLAALSLWAARARELWALR